MVKNIETIEGSPGTGTLPIMSRRNIHDNDDKKNMRKNTQSESEIKHYDDDSADHNQSSDRENLSDNEEPSATPVPFVANSTEIVKSSLDTQDQHSNTVPQYKENSICNIKLCSFFTLLIAIMVYIILMMNSPSKTEILAHNKINKCSFVNLKKSFPKQNDDLWNTITIGIEGILNNNPATPGTYLFLHENNHFTNDLIEKIANASSSCFDPNLKPIRLLIEDFKAKDYGTIIEKYKENIKDGGVLIVANLDEIPPENAKALHTICDSYSPIVERVIIFLTLTVNANETGKPLEIAENKLNYLWGSTINQNELEPIITRVTDSVIRLDSSE